MLCTELLSRSQPPGSRTGLRRPGSGSRQHHENHPTQILNLCISELTFCWRRTKEKKTKDEMVGWHHRLNGHEFQQAPWVGDGQGGLACCSPWGWKEPDTTEWLNWTELNWQVQISAETTSLSFKTGNSYRTRNSQCSSLKSEEFSYLGKVSLLSIQAFSGLDEVHPHYGGQSVLFSLRI